MLTALNRKLVRDLLQARGQLVAVAAVTACAVTAFVALEPVEVVSDGGVYEVSRREPDE